ncbi:MAG TPA: hypothetical protein VMZ53_03170 [Kofleriaceae bacterium]|nr:hypothetical protein [Kofleriaceae bacterium]
MSRTTYERLKSFCETNNISMSQFVETRVGDFLGQNEGTTTVDIIRPTLPRPTTPSGPSPSPAKPALPVNKSETRPAAATSTTMSSPAQQVPMTSAAARFAVDPPPPVIKPKQEQPAPKPAEKKADQIFTF